MYRTLQAAYAQVCGNLPWRLACGVGLLVVLALSSARSLGEFVKPPRANDPKSVDQDRYRQLFAGVRPLLPPRQVIGFVNQADPSPVAPLLLQTRFVLAPLQFANGTDYPLVLVVHEAEPLQIPSTRFEVVYHDATVSLLAQKDH